MSLFKMTIWIILKVKRNEKDDLKRIQMKEIISVDVERVTCLMLHFILMLKLSIKVYFLKEQQIYKKKASKALDQIVGR